MRKRTAHTTTRTLAAILSALVLPLALARPGLANQRLYSFEASPWAGAAYADAQTGDFSYCVVTAGYQTGTQLAFVLYANKVFQMMLANDTWQLGRFSQYDVPIKVDNFAVGTFEARTAAEDTLLIQFGDRPDVIRAIKNGQIIVINPGPAEQRYTLSATAKALTEMEACVAQEAARPKANNPFANVARPKSQPPAPSR